MFFVLVNARYFVTARSGVGGGGRPVGAGAAGPWGRGAGGGRYVSAVAADGRREECGRPSDAERPSPYASRILRPRIPMEVASSSLPPLFDIPLPLLKLTNCQDNNGWNLKDKRLRLFEMLECKPNNDSYKK